MLLTAHRVLFFNLMMRFYVRRSPGYQAQQNVVVEGEILFGGSYAMTSREERLSDLINKAGGATNYAYLRGAKLTRCRY